MGSFEIEDGDFAKRGLILRDGSKGKTGEKDELGNFRQLVVGIVEEVNDDNTRVKKMRQAYPQPRNWHLSEGVALDPKLPNILDRRLSVSLIADYEHDFPGWKLDTTESSPYKDDWKFDNKSTRIVDYHDPKGRTALFSQHCKVVDDHLQQYTAALPMSRTIGTHDVAAAGYLWDDKLGQAGWIDTIVILNPADVQATGRDGTPIGIAGVRTDAHFEWTTIAPDTSGGAQHGSIYFDTMDVSAYGVPSIGAPFKVTVAWDPTVKNLNSGLGNETGKWRPWYRIPFVIPEDPPWDGPVRYPGDGGGNIPLEGGGGTLCVPLTNGPPDQTIPQDGAFGGLTISDDGGGARSVWVEQSGGIWAKLLTGAGGLTTGTNAARPATPAAVGNTYAVTDKLNGPAGGSSNLDPSTAVGVGLLDGLTWGFVALINGWPQTVSSSWVFTGAPTVGTGGSLRATGTGTISATKLQANNVLAEAPPATNCPLVWNGSTWASAALGTAGGGTGQTTWTPNNSVVYVGSGALTTSGAPSSQGGDVFTVTPSTGVPAWRRGLNGGQQIGSNLAGVQMNVSGMQSTGTGVGGALVFQVTKAGTTGTTLNAYADAVKIDGKTNVVLNATGSALATSATDGFTYLPSCSGTPTGVPTSFTGAIPFVVDSTNLKLYARVGGLWTNMSAGPLSQVLLAGNSTGGTSILVTAGDSVQFGGDAILSRPATATLKLSDSATGTTFQAYNTTDSDISTETNWERGSFGWASNILKVSTESGGTGSARNMELWTGGVARVRVDSTGNVITNASGSALATNATTGFTYIDNSAGTPTGVPGTSVTGATPLDYDATNNKLFAYSNSSWRDVGHLPKGYVQGLVHSWTSTTVSAVAPGSCRDGSDTVDLVLAASTSIDITVAGAGGINTKVSAATISTTNASPNATTSASILSELGMVSVSGITFSSSTTTVTASADVRGTVAINDLIGSDSSGGFGRVTAIDKFGTTITLAAALSVNVGGGTQLKLIQNPSIKAANTGGDSRRINTITTAGTTLTASSNWGSASTNVTLTLGVRVPNQWLAVWIGSGATGTTVFASTQRTTPFTISGYTTSLRRIGWVRIDSAVGTVGGGVLRFQQTQQSSPSRVYMQLADFGDGATTEYRLLSSGVATTYTDVDCSSCMPPTSSCIYANVLVTTGTGGSEQTQLRTRILNDGNDWGLVQFLNFGANQTVSSIAFISTDMAQAFMYRQIIHTTGGSTEIDSVGFVDDL